MLQTETSKLLGIIRDSLIQSSIALAAASILSFFLVPKQTQIVVDDDVPAQLLTLGGKDNPKVVYVSTKKRSINPLPAVLAIAAAVAAAVIKYKYDADNGIISD
ncbi:MAG: hypothetical protein IJ007_09425 [Oscillospiraceae bacterium]|nr:hypothetical protein [Oscillospiraceae bacterium]